MTQVTRILTIEDDPTIRANIVAYLADEGYELLEAPDGVEGLRMFRESRPNLVLCDLRMPKLDGLDVLQQITQSSPETPVVIVSGAGMIADAIQALQRGAWDFITKPINDMQVLDAAIDKALDRARLLAENREYQRKLERVNQKLNTALQQLQADQEAGRKLQSRLLPPDNRALSGFVFSRRLYPATSLSGDFVDYFPIDHRHVGFYMADVSGHDTGSALVTVIVKTLMLHLRDALGKDADNTILMPERTLGRVNKEICRLDLDKYITMFYGVIDAVENTMTTSNGGQFPFPVLFNGHTTQTIGARSRPVGLFEDARFFAMDLHLPEQFLILLISDGIFELMPDRSNKEQYKDVVANIKSSVGELDEITRAMGLESAGNLKDDVTILTIKRQADVR